VVLLNVTVFDELVRVLSFVSVLFSGDFEVNPVDFTYIVVALVFILDFLLVLITFSSIMVLFSERILELISSSI
jgi:hypothetical protein